MAKKIGNIVLWIMIGTFNLATTVLVAVSLFSKEDPNLLQVVLALFIPVGSLIIGFNAKRIDRLLDEIEELKKRENMNEQFVKNFEGFCNNILEKMQIQTERIEEFMTMAESRMNAQDKVLDISNKNYDKTKRKGRSSL